ncbi:MAG: HAMP domain-containing histidine kinase [Epsilonproteobacteria bacterium]|nr:hypothetical protein [Campylobacterota bacterium]NPA57564.1 HAMP domain-containing histidine kinase [Campylobacterota bacterium]
MRVGQLLFLTTLALLGLLFLTIFNSISSLLEGYCHALDTKTLGELKYTLSERLFGLYALSSLLLLPLLYLFDRSLERRIGRITQFIRELLQRNYPRLPPDPLHQFHQLHRELNGLAKTLKKREEKKSKYTKKLKRLTRQRSELISALSHELKNPVAIIDGSVQTLLEEPDMERELQRSFILKIHRASGKIGRMIDRLTLAVKAESGKLELRRSRFSLCHLVQEAVTFLGERYRGREIEVECGKEEEVYGDREMVLTIVENLLDNALKYSQEKVVVRVHGRRVEVVDRGIGIDPSELKRVSKKFYRIHNSWDNSMGLGLFIVSYLLELHGSRLEIESQPGKGSTFSFQLP